MKKNGHCVVFCKRSSFIAAREMLSKTVLLGQRHMTHDTATQRLLPSTFSRRLVFRDEKATSDSAAPFFSTRQGFLTIRTQHEGTAWRTETAIDFSDAYHHLVVDSDHDP
jgi:hypothetical protein